MRRLLLLALVLGWSVYVWAAVDNSTLRAQSVFVEAESFTPSNEDWRVGAGWADDIYSPTSANAVLSNGGGGSGVATKEVTLPAAGTYHVWVRYLRIAEYTGSFGLRIEQGGQVVYDQKYRTKPVGNDWAPEWEKFPANLDAGPAKLTIYVAQGGIRQKLDCVLLTSVLDYQADYHDFAPQVFLRFRLTDPAAMAKANCSIYTPRGPRYYQYPGWLTAQGLGPDAEPLPTGQWSPWVDLTQFLDTSQFCVTTKFAFQAEGKPLDHVRGEYQIGVKPDEATATTLKEDVAAHISALIIPGDLAQFPDKLTLASALSRKHYEQAKAHGFSPAHATRIPLETYMTGWGDAFRSPQMLGWEMGGAAAVGLNSFNQVTGERYRVATGQGIKRGFFSDWLADRGWACPTAPDLPEVMDKHFATLASKYRAENPEAFKRHYRNILWDEPGSTPLDHLQKCPHCLAGFGPYLEKQGLKPADFGQATWEAVKPIAREAAVDVPTRKLHYWSLQYRDWTNAMLFKLGTEACRKHYGAQMLTCTNFTNGPMNGWIGSMTWGPDWFLFGRLQATTLMWSEDWASPGPECAGMTVDMLRAAARPHKLAVGQYIVANVPETLAQRSWSALMHGARILHYYCWGPYYTFADGMISDNPVTQKALGKVTAAIARVDADLHPAQPPPAQVAILWGKSHEIWQQEALVGTERRLTYLACAHSHTPVDMVSEPDVAEGILKGYKVLYVTESNLSRAAAAAIAVWVKAGGVLQLGPGAGLQDEYNEPLTELAELSGVKVESLEKPAVGARERYELVGMAPRGQVSLAAGKHWPAAQFPVLGYSEVCTPQGAEVLAAGADGKPAVVLNRVGKGQVLRLGFMPGLAYFKAAKGTAQELKTGFDPAQLAFMTTALRLARVTAPLKVSEPLVEAQLLRGPKADVVMLANWSGADLPAVTVTIRGAAKAKQVESNARVPLKQQKQGADLVVTCRLGDVEALVLRK